MIMKPSDPIVLAIQDLEASSKILQLVLAFILVHDPAALEALERLEPMLGDMAGQEPLTDRQIETMQSTLRHILLNVRGCRDTLPTPLR